MNFESISNLSAVSQSSAFTSADLTAAKYQPAASIAPAPLDTFQAIQPELLTLKGSAEVAGSEAPLTFVSINGSTTTQNDPSIFASVEQSTVGHSTAWGSKDWPIDGNDPGERQVTKFPGYDTNDNTISLFNGPFSHSFSAQLAATGIADLFIPLQGLWLSDSQRRAVHDTIERVVADVCEKSKPGDDLIGKICTAVGFAMWGAGYNPDMIASVTSRLSELLRGNFPGNAEESLAKMGQFFHNNSFWDPNINWVDPKNIGL